MPFVALTVLLRHLNAQAISFLALLLPFGALLFGAGCSRRGDHGRARWAAPALGRRGTAGRANGARSRSRVRAAGARVAAGLRRHR